MIVENGGWIGYQKKRRKRLCAVAGERPGPSRIFSTLPRGIDDEPDLVNQHDTKVFTLLFGQPDFTFLAQATQCTSKILKQSRKVLISDRRLRLL